MEREKGLKMPQDNQDRSAETGLYVTIDRNFVRQEAREAVRQFFRPLTAPFEPARERAPTPTKVKRSDDSRR